MLDVRVLNNMGTALVRQGKFEQAIPYLRRALRSTHPRAGTLELGAALAGAGQLNAASMSFTAPPRSIRRGGASDRPRTRLPRERESRGGPEALPILRQLHPKVAEPLAHHFAPDMDSFRDHFAGDRQLSKRGDRSPPERRSLWMPACVPVCGNAIAWHDNIPLVSFMMLRGRCRACATAIPWRYPIVEACTAVLFAVAWLVFKGNVAEFVLAVVFLAALVAVTVIDLRHQIIPDAITLPGVAVGLASSFATDRISWIGSVGGILLGASLFVAVIVLSRGGMGGGDLKLGAMLGAFLGWQALIVALFVAVMLGGTSAVTLLRRAASLARTPSLSAVPSDRGAVALFWGHAIVAGTPGFDR